MDQIKIIRKTRSLCPTCLTYIDAFVIEKDQKILLSKSCLKHGDFEITLSSTPGYYKSLDRFYFSIMKGNGKLREYELWPTLECNMNCTICCFGDLLSKMKRPSVTCSELEGFIKNSKVPFYILSGGEPTCHDELGQIIRIMKKYGKAVTINTNGYKLVNNEYLSLLMKSGLDRVNLQFDGFKRDAYFKLRGGDFLDIKLKAIENLKNMNMPTVFNATIARNINEEAIDSLVNYAAENQFINAINFFTICSVGGGKDWALNDYIMPDEVVDILEKRSEGKILKKNVFLFNKLHLAIKSLFSQKFCFYNQIYLLIRDAHSYEPIDKFLNLSAIEPWLDRYFNIFKINKLLAKTYLMLVLPVLLLRYCSFSIIKDFLKCACSYFLKTRGYLLTKRLFYISFSTGCDPYKVDYQILKNCQNEIFGPGSAGNLEYLGKDGLYCIGLERNIRKELK